MRKKWIVLASVLTLTACSMDEETAENLENAKQNFKAAAQNAGKAVSSGAKETMKKWDEANANRIEEAPNEEPGLPTVSYSTEEVKQGFNEAKQKVMQKVDELRDKSE